MNDINNNRLIVVGAGLAGLTVVHTLVEAGGSVTLLEKSPSILPSTSNSSFSSSGINGCNSSIQKAHNVEDSSESFLGDVLKTGTKKTDLLEVLCTESGSSIDWLTTTFGMTFTLSRSGGHTCARSHKTRDRATGLATVSLLAEAALKIAAANPEKLNIITEAAASQLVVSDNKEVKGVIYEKNGKIESVHGCVVLCTGGYGSDFNSSNSTIARYRPDLVNLSTACNLYTSLGDGIRLGEQAGAKLVDMMYVQVNPTGLVDPNDPGSRFKVTASESLRGDGGIILNRYGKRFVNELAKRDILSSEIMKNDGPFYIIINSRIARHVKAYIEDYMRSGLMTRCASGSDLAEAIGIAPDALSSTFEQYNASALAEKDEFGKTHFRNCPFEMTDSFCVAQIEPVIHYCTGGLMINTDGKVICSRTGKPVRGLYAAGEVTGGVHGASPFTGNDLLDCVVFGRRAAISAAKDVYGEQYVEARMNPEVVKQNLIDAIATEDDRIRKELGRKVVLEKELIEVKNRLETERAEVSQVCEKLRSEFGSLHQQLGKLRFNPSGKTLEETLSVDSGKSLSVELRGRRKQVEGEAEELRGQIAQHRAKIEESNNEKEALVRKMKQMKSEKSKLEKKLEEIHNSSSVIREIHQLEEAIAGFKGRQEKAEATQEELLKEHESKQREIRIEIDQIKAKKEEVQVMMGLEKVQQRKQSEELHALVDRMKDQLRFEIHFSQRAGDLASNVACPIFQRPLRRSTLALGAPQINGA